MHLRRLIVAAHQRHISPSSSSKTLSDATVKDYTVYKSALIFFGLVDSIYSNLFKVSFENIQINFTMDTNIQITLQKISVASDEQWPATLAEYIRHNDEALLKASERVLTAYRFELLPCASFDEFCDIVGE